MYTLAGEALSIFSSVLAMLCYNYYSQWLQRKDVKASCPHRERYQQNYHLSTNLDNNIHV